LCWSRPVSFGAPEITDEDLEAFRERFGAVETD
jgi:hypothetical protein